MRVVEAATDHATCAVAGRNTTHGVTCRHAVDDVTSGNVGFGDGDVIGCYSTICFTRGVAAAITGCDVTTATTCKASGSCNSHHLAGSPKLSVPLYCVLGLPKLFVRRYQA